MKKATFLLCFFFLVSCASYTVTDTPKSTVLHDEVTYEITQETLTYNKDYERQEEDADYILRVVRDRDLPDVDSNALERQKQLKIAYDHMQTKCKSKKYKIFRIQQGLEQNDGEETDAAAYGGPAPAGLISAYVATMIIEWSSDQMTKIHYSCEKKV